MSSDFLRLSDFFLLGKKRKGLTFSRHQLKHTGWIWYVFPRYELLKKEEIDVLKILTRSLDTTTGEVDRLAATAQQEMCNAVKRSVQKRTALISSRIDTSLSGLVLGTNEVPSQILEKGRDAVQLVHKSIVEAAGQAAAKQFTAAVSKALAQMLAYAREEAGAVVAEHDALPVGTRYVFRGDPYTLYVVEEPPRIRTVLWDKQKVELSFPYVVFLAYLKRGKFDLMQMFLRGQTLQKSSDELFTPPLPDIMEYSAHDDFRNVLRYRNFVCFPGPRNVGSAPADIVYAAQQVFWSSEFRSTHWFRSLREKSQKAGCSVDKWFELTKSDPLAGMKVSLGLKSTYTVQQFAEALKPPKDAFNARASLSRLEQYAVDLAPKVAMAVQEAVLEAIADTNGPLVARRHFESKLRETLTELKLGDEFAAVLRAEIEMVGSGNETERIISRVTKKTAEQLAAIVVPSMVNAVAAVREEFVVTE